MAVVKREDLPEDVGAEPCEYNLRQIVGALKSTIHAHGPITLACVASAAKRVLGALRPISPRGEYGLGAEPCECCGELVCDCLVVTESSLDETGYSEVTVCLEHGRRV